MLCFLNSRIPLVGISSCLVFNCGGQMTASYPAAMNVARSPSDGSRTSTHSLRNEQLFRPTATKDSLPRPPNHQTARATLYPEVTEPFCRLPLHTFCSKLETIHLGHLLRFLERLDWKLIISLEFSWGTKRAGGTKKSIVLFRRKESFKR